MSTAIAVLDQPTLHMLSSVAEEQGFHAQCQGTVKERAPLCARSLSIKLGILHLRA